MRWKMNELVRLKLAMKTLLPHPSYSTVSLYLLGGPLWLLMVFFAAPFAFFLSRVMVSCSIRSEVFNMIAHFHNLLLQPCINLHYLLWHFVQINSAFSLRHRQSNSRRLLGCQLWLLMALACWHLLSPNCQAKLFRYVILKIEGTQHVNIPYHTEYLLRTLPVVTSCTKKFAYTSSGHRRTWPCVKPRSALQSFNQAIIAFLHLKVIISCMMGKIKWMCGFGCRKHTNKMAFIGIAQNAWLCCAYQHR